jgi:hypothetical protein
VARRRCNESAQNGGPDGEQTRARHNGGFRSPTLEHARIGPLESHLNR